MGKKKSRSRGIKKTASTVKKRSGMTKKGAVVKSRAKVTKKRSSRATSVRPYDLWYLVQEHRLSFEPEAQLLATGLISSGETRLTEKAREEAYVDTSGEVTVDLTGVTKRLQHRAKQSANTLFNAMVKEAGGTNRVISVAAFHAAEQLTFCTVWPFCVNY